MLPVDDDEVHFAKVLRRCSESFSNGSDFAVIEIVTDLTFSSIRLIL